jgi:large subunit ribosomal protein L17
MAHGISRRKLSRPTDQRLAMLRSLVTGLLWHGKVVTTEARAKEARGMAEKLITLARTDTIANRRLARRLLYPVGLKYTPAAADSKAPSGKSGSVETAVYRLFTEVGPQYKERAGGYVRLIRLGALPPRKDSPHGKIGTGGLRPAGSGRAGKITESCGAIINAQSLFDN